MKRIIIITLVVLAGAFAGTAGYFYLQEKNLAQGKIVQGVKIAGTEVGNLTPGEAIKILRQKEDAMLASAVKLKYKDKYWTLPYSTMATTNLNQLVNKAANLGRGKGIFTNYTEIRSAKRGEYNFSLKIIPNAKRVGDRVYKIKVNFDTKPVETKIAVSDDNNVTITPPREGVALDNQATTKAVLLAIKPNTATTVEAVAYPLKPKFTAEEVKKWQISGYITTFTTGFNPLNKDRTENVRVAAHAVDKVIVYPGQEFSFNNIVGPRSKEAGYKESLVIQNNIFTPGLGGGVCQVSSTLYNNLLKSNIKIIERRRHSLPVAYVSPGLDATVAFGFIDLKFKNTYDFPIIIRTKITSNKLFIGLLGDKSKIPDVTITSNIDKVLMPSGSRTVYDPNLPKGKKVVDEPKKGYKVTVYKKVATQSGAKTTVISRDTYPPTPEIIRIGTNTKTAWGEVYGQAN